MSDISDAGNEPPAGDELLDVEANYLATGDIAEGHATDLQHLAGARAALGAVGTWHELDDDLENLISTQIQTERSSGPSELQRPSQISLRMLSAAAVLTAIVAFGAGWLVNSQQDADTGSETASAATVLPTPNVPTAVAPTAEPTAAPTPAPTETPPALPTAEPSVVPTPTPDVEVALSSGDYAPEATASAALRETSSGVEVKLRIDGLPPAPDDGYYQGWFRTNDDVLITIGTFHLRGDDEPVTLWSGVDLDVVQLLTVTVQRLDGGPASSGIVVLRGPVSVDR